MRLTLNFIEVVRLADYPQLKIGVLNVSFILIVWLKVLNQSTLKEVGA